MTTTNKTNTHITTQRKCTLAEEQTSRCLEDAERLLLRFARAPGGAH